MFDEQRHGRPDGRRRVDLRLWDGLHPAGIGGREVVDQVPGHGQDQSVQAGVDVTLRLIRREQLFYDRLGLRLKYFEKKIKLEIISAKSETVGNQFRALTMFLLQKSRKAALS